MPAGVSWTYASQLSGRTVLGKKRRLVYIRFSLLTDAYSARSIGSRVAFFVSNSSFCPVIAFRATRWFFRTGRIPSFPDTPAGTRLPSCAYGPVAKTLASVASARSHFRDTPSARDRTIAGALMPINLQNSAAASILTRISHRFPAAAPDTLALTGRTRCSRFDVVSTTPSPPSTPCTPPWRRLGVLVTKNGEICRLTGCRRPWSPQFIDPDGRFAQGG
jgi:hypothetical protein